MGIIGSTMDIIQLQQLPVTDSIITGGAAGGKREKVDSKLDRNVYMDEQPTVLNDTLRRRRSILFANVGM